MTQKTSKEHNCANLVADKGKPTAAQKTSPYENTGRTEGSRFMLRTTDNSILHFLHCHSLLVAPKTEIFVYKIAVY